MSYKRSKVIRTAEDHATATCPPPCGKIRYITRASARKAAARIQGERGGGRLRAYSGNDSDHASCQGFYHLTGETNIRRTAFYREGVDFSRIHGLPEGWTIGFTREGTRWRYTIYVPGEEPMPSVHLYSSREAAENEAVADIAGESRSV